MQLQKCEKCRCEDAVMSQCNDCSCRFCRMCISFAGQCALCAEKSRRAPLVCGVCHNHADGQKMGWNVQKCISCRTWACETCSMFPQVNRPTSVVCVLCQPPRQIPFTCTRCMRTVGDDNNIYFCEICAGVLCGECLPMSFECGVLKCHACCPSPVHMCAQRPMRTVIDDEAKISMRVIFRQVIVKSPPPPVTLPHPGKYRQLFNRVKLGEGAQGVVYKCTTADGEVVVSKEMEFPQSNQTMFEARLRQAEKMRKLSHKHLIRYLDVFGSRNPFKISVIMPYYSEGDLKEFICRQRKPIEEHKLCSIILQIAGALEYLSSQNPPLTHCDIKPENILLLSKEEQVLLMDLDLCRSFEAQPSVSSRVLDEREKISPTYEYCAPELARCAGCPKSDIFSLGVVAFVLATLPEFAMLTNGEGAPMVLGYADWTKESLAMGIRKAILSHTRQYSDALIDLIIKMLLHDTRERPEAIAVRVELTKIMEEQLLGVGR